jgi:YidC/Oxa1 family membrane protein insertase
MEKRLIVALVLSVAVMLVFQNFYTGKQPRKVEVADKQDVLPEAEMEEPAKEQTARHLAGNRIAVDTEKFILTFDDVAGSIVRVQLIDFIDKTGEAEKLIDVPDAEYGIFATDLNINVDRFRISQRSNKITLEAKGSRLGITKEIYLGENENLLECVLTIKNVSDRQIKDDYSIVTASYLRDDSAVSRRFIETNAMVNGVISKSRRPKKGDIYNDGIVSWAALKSRYFALIMKPYQPTRGTYVAPLNDDNMAVGIRMPEFSLSPSEEIEYRYTLYIGPVKYNTLKELNLGFEGIVDYGIFGGISKLLLSVLNFTHSVLGSWGISIIFLSFLVNMVLFPLTLKSLTSMKKLQEVQPEMERLKKQHKDNPQKLNKEIMELYKKNKVNPFGGCLPLLLQMPIFIALYQALIRNVDLKGASFLWINDLSAPDAVGIPFTLPLVGNSINILPLLMVGAMFVQQKFSMMKTAMSEDQKQQQKMMNVMMPVIFGFIFYNFPSGLVLYWLTNTILMFAGQRAIAVKMKK